MKDSRSYSKYYKILGLTYDSDLKSCKRAYKQSVKQWHPDKFINNNSAQLVAEEKLKEINIAYSQITEYYQRYRVMPGQIDTSLNTSKQAFDVSSLYENLNSKNISTKRNIRKYLIFFLFSSLLIFIYQILFDTNPDSKSNLAKDKTSIISLNEPTSNQKKYFSSGSSFTEVIKIQGEPDFRISQTWYYGNSWVLFQNGVVTDWYEDKKYPLKLISENDIIYKKLKILPDTFEKGDSKSDVRAIQGDPVRKSRNIWYYTISKVYFKNNKVVSWFNSPLDPLRVKK